MSGLKASTQVIGALSSFCGPTAPPVPPPPADFWALFNGSAATPWSNNGPAWEESTFSTTQTIALDSTRFAFIYGNPLSIVIGTYSNINTAPTFGTPVAIDGTLSGDVLDGNGCLLAANTVYVAYFDENTSTRYGRVFTISGSTITAHTSTMIASLSNVVYPCKNIATLDSGHVIELFSGAATDAQVQVMAIDGSFNVTFGTPFSLSPFLGISQQIFNSILALSASTAIVFAPTATTSFPVVIAVSISGTTVSLINSLQLDATNKMNGLGAALAMVSSTQFIAAWNAQQGGSIVNKGASINLSGGVLSAGPISNINTILNGGNLDNSLAILDLIYSTRTGQFLLIQQLFIGETTVANDFVQYVGLNENVLFPGKRVAINCNAFSLSSPSIPCYFGSMLDQDHCVFPSMSWDGANYGCVIFSDTNTMTEGDVIFFIEGGINATTTPTATLGTGTGTLHSHTITINGVDLSNMLIPLSAFQIGGDQYVVDSILFTAGNTFITTTTPLTAPYLGDNVTANLITQIVDQSANAYVFSQASSNQQPITGFDAFGNQSILCYGNNGQPTYLECDSILYPPQFTCYISCVCQATDESVYLVTGCMVDNNANYLDVESQMVQILPGNITVGSFDLTGQTNLVECLRKPYNSTVTFNGNPNDSLSFDVLAIGNAFNYLIGTRPDLAVPFAGPIYAVKLRWGQPTPSQIAADRAYFVSKYGIS